MRPSTSRTTSLLGDGCFFPSRRVRRSVVGRVYSAELQYTRGDSKKAAPSLRKGDILLVRPGDRVFITDGVLEFIKILDDDENQPDDRAE